MVSEKKLQIATIAAMIAGSSLLGLILDSRRVLYALAVLTAAVCVLYGWIAFRGKLPSYPAISHAAPSFFAWTLYAGLFAMSTLQVIPLWSGVVVGIVVSALVGFLWPWKINEHRYIFSALLGALTVEWFLILQFATANYMVLGALMAIAYTSTALLFEFQYDETVQRSVIVRHIATTIAIALIFILGFSWTL